MSIFDALRAALAQAGQPFDKPLICGELLRYGPRKSQWLVVHQLSGGHLAAAFGDWRQGTFHKFKSWMNGDLANGLDLDTLHRELRERRQEAEARTARKSAQAAKLAAVMVEHCPTEGEHPYLTRKQVQAYGIHFGADETGKFVAVPMVDLLTGNLKSVQRIYEDTKRFLPGTPLKSNALCHPIGGDLATLDPAGELWLAEGYATAATIHEATNKPVLVAFDSGNLERVAKAARQRWPDMQLVIAADNDCWKAGHPVDPNKPDGPKKPNAGVKAARQAAKATGARLIIPDFTNLVDEGECWAKEEGPTDFNDLVVLAGLQIVKRQFKKSEQKLNDPRQSRGLIRVSPSKGQIMSH